MTGTIRDRHANGGQGMNWLRPAKRLAIYIRDGLACAYCEAAIEDGTKLTLDHLTPHSHGGTNDATNIVTCCHKCNSARGNRDWRQFAATVAAYLNHGITAEAIISHIETTVQRPLDVPAAKAIIAQRGGFTQALQG
mgnify:CR=1 FL=1